MMFMKEDFIQRTVEEMSVTIKESWQSVLKKSMLNDENQIKSIFLREELVGSYGEVNRTMLTVKQALASENLLAGIEPFETIKTDFTLENPHDFPWLFLENDLTAYGGKSRCSLIKTFLYSAFEQGYCYLNLFVPCSFRVFPHHVKFFSDFILEIPQVLGAYPSLESLARVCFYMVSKCPELLQVEIPVIAFNPISFLFHVTDRRGVPSNWSIMNVVTVADVVSLLSKFKGRDFMMYPVGASFERAQCYANWAPRHARLPTYRFVAWTSFAEKIKNMLDNFQHTEEYLKTVLEELNDLGFANFVNHQKRFPKEQDDDSFFINLSAAQSFRNAIGYYNGLIHVSDDGRFVEAFDVLKEAVTHLKVEDIQTQAIFERQQGVVWANQFWDLPRLDSVAKSDKKYIAKHLAEWSKLEDEELKTQDVYDNSDDGQIQKVQVVNSHQPSAWRDAVIGTVAAVTAAVVAFLLRIFWKSRGEKLIKTFKRFKKPTASQSIGGGGDDDDPDDEGPKQHPYNLSDVEFSDEEVQQEVDRLLAEHDANFQRAHVAVIEGDLVQIREHGEQWASHVEALDATSDNALYKAFAIYLRVMQSALIAFEATSQVPPDVFVNLQQIENNLRQNGFNIGISTLTEIIRVRVQSTYRHRVRSMLLVAMDALGDEFQQRVQDAWDFFDAIPFQHITQMDRRVWALVQVLLKAVKDLGETESNQAKLSIICSIEAVLASLTAMVGVSFVSLQISAVQRNSMMRIATENLARGISDESRGESSEVDASQTKFLDMQVKKVEAEMRVLEESARTQQVIAQATRDSTLRDHILQPVNTLANIGMAAAFFRRGRVPIVPAGVPASGVSASPSRFTPFGGSGHRLGGRVRR
jgi:hypothetical protein